MTPASTNDNARGINEDYGSRSAVNAYSRFLSQQRGERGIGDYQQSFQRSTPKFTAGYGRRGLAGPGVKTGIYQTAMKNYLGDYNQNLNRMYADQASEGRQYDLSEAQMTTARDRALADMETDKAKEIALAASYLSALKPQFS